MPNSNLRKDAINHLIAIASIRVEEIRTRQKDAQARANEAEGAMLSRYDTFKEEGQYLANALKVQLTDAEMQLEMAKKTLEIAYDPSHEVIRILSFVTVQLGDDSIKHFFVFSSMAGETVTGKYTVITPHSPIGNALLGKEAGDEFHYVVNHQKIHGEVLEVQ